MSLQYLKLSNIFTINIIDNNNILDTKSLEFSNFFKSRRLNYTTSNNVIYSENYLNILIKKKSLVKNNFLSNKSNILILVDNNNNYEWFDSINNVYIKNKFSNVNMKYSIYCIINKYLYKNVTLSLSNGYFILPSGFKNEIDLRLGLERFYFIVKSDNLNIFINCKNKPFKTKQRLKQKIVKKDSNKKYLSINYLNLYIYSTLLLDTKYFKCSWNYQKYIKILNKLFDLRKYSKELHLILKKVLLYSLEEQNNNEIYNNYKLFIYNYPLYNNIIIDLLNFKTECKRIQIDNLKIIDNNLDLEIPDSSLDFYTSNISFNNWYDEFESGDCFGFLIHSNFKRNCIEGLEPDIYVRNINQSVLSTDDFLDSHYFYFNKYNYFDDGRKTVPMISFDGIGKGNIFLPLYICDIHFKLVISNIKLLTSMNIYQTPIKFKKENILIYITLISEFLCKTFCDTSFTTEKWLNIFFNYLIFVKEIVNIYYTDIELENLFSKHYNKIKFNSNFVIGLYILLILNKIEIKIDVKSLILKILEEDIRLKCSKYCIDLKTVLDDVFDINYNKFNLFLDNFNYSLIINKNLINFFEKALNKNNDLSFIKKIWGLHCFTECFKDEYDEIRDSIDKSYGTIPEEKINELKECITMNMYKEETDKISGVINPLFSNHIIYNKIKIVKIMNVLNRIDLDFCTNEMVDAMILQGLLQRNFNKRKIAIKSRNKLYFNPVTNTTKCIMNCLKIFLKIWSINSTNMISNMYLMKQLKNLINIKHIIGIFYILNNRTSLTEVLLNCIKEGDVKNLSVKLSLLSNPNFVDKKYIWLLPIRKFNLEFVEVKKVTQI